MSMLSKLQFEKFWTELEGVQQQLTQQSRSIQNKIILACAKIDYLNEKTQCRGDTFLNQGADQLLKIHNRMQTAKQSVKRLHGKYITSLEEKKQQVTKKIIDLQNNVKISNTNRLKQFKNLQSKLDEQLKQIQMQLIKQSQRQNMEISKLQKTFMKQIQICQEQINNNKKKLVQSQSQLVETIQQIYNELKNKISQIKQSRKARKINFLQLLENVVKKIKESQTIEL